jgi:hypothetical protein
MSIKLNLVGQTIKLEMHLLSDKFWTRALFVQHRGGKWCIRSTFVTPFTGMLSNNLCTHVSRSKGNHLRHERQNAHARIIVRHGGSARGAAPRNIIRRVSDGVTCYRWSGVGREWERFSCFLFFLVLVSFLFLVSCFFISFSVSFLYFVSLFLVSLFISISISIFSIFFFFIFSSCFNCYLYLFIFSFFLFILVSFCSISFFSYFTFIYLYLLLYFYFLLFSIFIFYILPFLIFSLH